jgi:hypothetical protein
MTFLPERHRSPPPQAWRMAQTRYGGLAHPTPLDWRPAPRRSFMPILMTAAVAAVIGYMVRSAVEQPQPKMITVERQARAPAAPPVANGPCSEADGTVRGGPNVSGFGPPRDVFGFLPRCDGGRR